MYKLSCSSSIKWFSSSFLVNHSSLDCGERGTKKIFYLFSPVPFKVKKKKKSISKSKVGYAIIWLGKTIFVVILE